MSVEGKVVIITGAAQGVGRYVARSFGAHGARVVVADKGPTDTIASELKGLEAEFLAIPVDVTDEDSVRSLMDQVYRKWGRIDVLVNDAGIAPHFAVGAPRWPKIRDLPRELFDRVMDTNLAGTFQTTKHVLPYMESIYSGHIINFGQGSLRAPPARDGRPSHGSAIYNTSKIAIRAFTRQVADEERDFNICIISMGPGGSTTSQPTRRPEPEPGGVWGGIVTEDSPAWAQASAGAVHVDEVGDRYLTAAEAPMDLSGYQVIVRDGKLEVSPD